MALSLQSIINYQTSERIIKNPKTYYYAAATVAFVVSLRRTPTKWWIIHSTAGPVSATCAFVINLVATRFVYHMVASIWKVKVKSLRGLDVFVLGNCIRDVFYNTIRGTLGINQEAQENYNERSIQTVNAKGAIGPYWKALKIGSFAAAHLLLFFANVRLTQRDGELVRSILRIDSRAAVKTWAVASLTFFFLNQKF